MGDMIRDRVNPNLRNNDLLHTVIQYYPQSSSGRYRSDV
jgi:hypothetical protein